MNDATHEIMKMIDTSESIHDEIQTLIIEGEIQNAHDMHDFILDQFPTCYPMPPGEAEIAYKDVLVFVPGLVLAALEEVDYQVIFRHYKSRLGANGHVRQRN